MQCCAPRLTAIGDDKCLVESIFYVGVGRRAHVIESRGDGDGESLSDVCGNVVAELAVTVVSAKKSNVGRAKVLYDSVVVLVTLRGVALFVSAGALTAAVEAESCA